jgi:hypothetical protein
MVIRDVSADQKSAQPPYSKFSERLASGFLEDKKACHPLVKLL